MRLTGLLLFAAGYVLGAKAGHRRYEQIVTAASRAASHLEDKSARQRIIGYADGTRPLLSSLLARCAAEPTAMAARR